MLHYYLKNSTEFQYELRAQEVGLEECAAEII